MSKKASKVFFHNLLIAVLAFIWLIPIIWLVATSFSEYPGMNTSTFFPKNWSLIHYKKLFQIDSVNQFPVWFMNTFKIAVATCLVSTCFVLMVAYAMSFGKFKARKGLMNAAVMLNLFPGVLSMSTRGCCEGSGGVWPSLMRHTLSGRPSLNTPEPPRREPRMQDRP